MGAADAFNTIDRTIAMLKFGTILAFSETWNGYDKSVVVSITDDVFIPEVQLRPDRR
jgi:hypothetical protein